jgi:hypothetical protein
VAEPTVRRAHSNPDFQTAAVESWIAREMQREDSRAIFDFLQGSEAGAGEGPSNAQRLVHELAAAGQALRPAASVESFERVREFDPEEARQWAQALTLSPQEAHALGPLAETLGLETLSPEGVAPGTPEIQHAPEDHIEEVNRNNDFRERALEAVATITQERLPADATVQDRHRTCIQVMTELATGTGHAMKHMAIKTLRNEFENAYGQAAASLFNVGLRNLISVYFGTLLRPVLAYYIEAFGQNPTAQKAKEIGAIIAVATPLLLHSIGQLRDMRANVHDAWTTGARTAMFLTTLATLVYTITGGLASREPGNLIRTNPYTWQRDWLTQPFMDLHDPKTDDFTHNVVHLLGISTFYGVVCGLVVAGFRAFAAPAGTAAFKLGVGPSWDKAQKSGDINWTGETLEELGFYGIASAMENRPLNIKLEFQLPTKTSLANKVFGLGAVRPGIIHAAQAGIDAIDRFGPPNQKNVLAAVYAAALNGILYVPFRYSGAAPHPDPARAAHEEAGEGAAVIQRDPASQV